MRPKDRSVLLLVTFLGLASAPCLLAQRTVEIEYPAQGNFKVKWVGAFSSRQDFGKKTGVARRFLNLILGKSDRRFVRPINLVVVGSTVWWVLDQGGQTISRIDRKKEKFDILKFDDYPAFPSLVGICMAPNGDLYFTDSSLNHVFAMNKKGKALRIVAGELQLSRPTGVAFSNATNQLWVAETGAHRLLVLDAAGNFIKYVGKRGEAAGEFNFPTFLWIDREGLVYVVDSMNFRIQILSRDGGILTVFGEGGDASGYFAHPKGIATDSYGHIYIVDALFNTVQVFNRQGDFLLNFGSQGRKPGEFWLPAGIFIAMNNMIYIADSYNARIQIFELSPADD